jgi:hypothetical protein
MPIPGTANRKEGQHFWYDILKEPKEICCGDS